MKLPAIFFTLVFFASACPAEDRRRPEPELGRVEYSGCTEVLAGPRCRLGADRKLRLWIAGGFPKELRLESATFVETVQGGARYEVTIAAEKSELSIHHGEHTAWKLPLIEAPLDPRLLDAKSALDRGALDEAEKSALASEDRARASQLLAKIAFRRDQRDRAIELHREAVELARKDGLSSVAADSSQALVFLLTMARRFSEAAVALAGSRAVSAEYFDGQVGEAYYAGLLARELGDFGTALAELDRAALLAARLGYQRLQFLSEEMLSTTLVQVGRHEEALARLARLNSALSPDVAPCTRAALLTNYGWAAAVAGSTVARPLLEEALGLHETSCANARNAMNTSINLALVALEEGRVADAERYLRSREVEPETRVLLWLRDIDARIALARGRAAEALAGFEELEGLAGSALALDASWRAAVGRGRALEALARAAGEKTRAFEARPGAAGVQNRALDAVALLREAEAAHRSAEELLDRESALVPITRGRDSFLQDRGESAERLVGILLELDAPERALAAATHAQERARAERAWSLARLSPEARRAWEDAVASYRVARDQLEAEARADWKFAPKLRATRQRERSALAENIRAKLFAATIRPPPRVIPKIPNEATLTFHRIPTGYAAFLARATASTLVRTSTTTTPIPETIARDLIASFLPALETAHSIRVLTPEIFAPVDFHALRFEDRLLLDRAPILYGPTTSTRAAAKHLLIVADPNENLHNARTEADQITTLTQNLGYHHKRYDGAQATRAAILHALPQHAVFHYAGHAESLPELPNHARNRNTWNHALPLHDGHLTASDIYALDRPPTVIILSGCETAPIAEAFLLAGTRGAIATVQPIKDEHAITMSRRLFTLLAADPTLIDDVGAWLRRAQLELASSQPTTNWAAYRAFGR